MEIDHILKNLNKEQREAVTAENLNLLVLAGAGSGKTRVLVHRLAWLMQVHQISPFGILAVTFTNKAAKEMKNRVESLIGTPATGMWLGTFHGIAHRLLRAHWQEANLPQSFQILDGDDQYRLIRKVMKALNLDEGEFPPRQVQSYICRKKDEGIRPQYVTQAYDPFEKILVRVYTEYEETCQRMGVVDFAELLLRAHELWLNKPHVLEHYRNRFQHILVDEFQDTNLIQYAWLRMLTHANNNIMIVGDDDQSIYGWRGAQIENIHRFQKDFPNTKIIRLEQNYRSPGNILKAANGLIAQNDDRLGKKLWTEQTNGEPISLYTAYNDRDEAHYIVSKLLDWQQHGNRYDEAAVLYRSNAQSRVIEEKLIKMNVPYRVYGGLRFFERAEIKDALAYLYLISNRNNDSSFERVINTPTRGIGDRTVSMIRDRARHENVSMWDSANQILKENSLPPRASNALLSFINLIEQMDQATQNLPLSEQTDHMLQASGLMDHFRKEKSDKAQARIENLEELVNATKQFENDDNEEDLPPLLSFLSHAALEAGENQADEFTDSVQLMTLHSAKGLEFPLVFLSGLEEQLFPHQMSINEPGRLEEERRLCYVGITRSKQKLYITHAQTRRLHGRETFQIPSRFINEIPNECIEEVRIKTKVSAPISYETPRYSSIKQTEASDTGFRLGQSVMHKVFGEGVILNFEGSGPRARIQVQFNRAGTKWLVAEFANLQAL